MKEIAMIENRITEEAENNTADIVFYIENGYFQTWAEEHHTKHSDFYSVEKDVA